MSDKMTG